MESLKNNDVKTKMEERMMQSLEWIDVALEQDAFYAEQKSQAQECLAKYDFEMYAAIQMTLRNIEQEAAYQAGFKDCLAIIKTIV